MRRHEGFVRLARPDGRATRYPVSVAFARHDASWKPRTGTTGARPIEVAYAVTRRSGTAVARNRLRRRLRSAVGGAAERGAVPEGLYLVRADPAARALDFGPLCEAVSGAMGAAAARAGRAAEGGLRGPDGEAG